MTAYFADASYWIALITPNDEFHELATEYATLLDDAEIMTTQLVLNEVLNPRSGTTPQRRMAAVELVDQIMRNPHINIIPQTPEQFDAALYLIRRIAADKEWSLTDCSSFLIMEEWGIFQVLTSDHHFEQAGFTVLLE